MGYKLIENQIDYNTYVSLRALVGWNNYNKEQVERALSNSYYSVVVVVKPEFQGKGVGTLIIHTILKFIEDEMCSQGRVSIQLISEKGKEDFYIKQGFKLIPHEYCGPALRKIIHK